MEAQGFSLEEIRAGDECSCPGLFGRGPEALIFFWGARSGLAGWRFNNFGDPGSGHSLSDPIRDDPSHGLLGLVASLVFEYGDDDPFGIVMRSAALEENGQAGRKYQKADRRRNKEFFKLNLTVISRDAAGFSWSNSSFHRSTSSA